MIVDALSAVYGAAATWRRRWYASRGRRLTQPVISVGNLRVGGTGKTPAVEAIARLLLEQGEHPAILSRGYARRKPSADVTVVSDYERVLADVDHAGDEPMLLARALPGVPVLICADRHRAGRQAEAQFGSTVHVLDDGFQHVQLWRDVDLLLVDEADLADRVLPAGRLREPLANGAAAHALIVPASTAGDRSRTIAERLGVSDVFHAGRSLGAPITIGPGVPAFDKSALVFAVAGIARPERFFADLRTSGVHVAGTMEFRDHHRFGQADVNRIADAARACGAAAVVTTGKDAIRLEGLDLSAMAFAAVPLHTTIEPAAAFSSWLAQRLSRAREAGNRSAS